MLKYINGIIFIKTRIKIRKKKQEFCLIKLVTKRYYKPIRYGTYLHIKNGMQ